MKTEPLSPALGARITGVDLTRASGDVVGSLRDKLLGHHVLAISDQTLGRDELQAFGQLWGELLSHPSNRDDAHPYIGVLGGSGAAKGKRWGAWHSDMSWHPTPPWITMLHAKTVPPWGGDTGYVNQHLAWEALDGAAKDIRRMFRRDLANRAQLEDLHALHTGKGFGANVPDSVHPVVRTHDETGRPALYVNPEFTSHIVDMDDTASKLLLWPLWMHATGLEFSYRHAWRSGDLVIWDNRSVMHTAIVDYDEPREMIRVVVKGDTPR